MPPEPKVEFNYGGEMPHTKKSGLNTLLLALILIALLVVIFVLVSKKPPVDDQVIPVGQTQTNQNPNGQDYQPNQNQTGGMQVNWKNLIPQITTALKRDFPAGLITNVRILRDDTDLTGDGIPETLVTTGGGGAYTTEFSIMRIENGEVVTARMKDEEGVRPVSIYGGASVVNQLDYGLDSHNQAFYYTTVYRDTNTGNISNCNLFAYKWNSQTKLFDFSQALSNQLKPGYCSGLNNQG